MHGFEVGIWDPADERLAAAFLEASVQVDGRPNRGVPWFLWKFRDAPFGPASVAYAIESVTGRIAGVVAFGMWRLVHDGREFPAGVSYETFVLPQFQRRGLFSALTRAAEDDAARRGAVVLFNFPNAASGPGFLKLGWHDLGGVLSWARPRRPLRALLRRAGVGGAPAADPSGGVALSGETVEAGIRGRASWGPVWAGHRSAEMLAWRFSGKAGFAYRAVMAGGAVAVVRSIERRGVREAQLLEVLWEGAMTGGSLRAVARRAGSETDADVVTLLLTHGHPLRALAGGAGFVPVRNRIQFFARALGPTVPALQDARDWALSWTEVHMV